MFIFLSHLLRTIFYSICYIEQKENLQIQLEHRIYSFLDKLPFHVLSFSCFVLFGFWVFCSYFVCIVTYSKQQIWFTHKCAYYEQRKPNNNTIAASTAVGDKTNCNIVDASVVSSGGLLTAINTTFYCLLQNVFRAMKLFLETNSSISIMQRYSLFLH